MAIPVKLTRSHQITLPKRLLKRAGWLDQEFFVADLEGDTLLLRPLTLTPQTQPASLSALRRHFERLGVTEGDAKDAVVWARRQGRAEHRRRRIGS